MKFLKKLYYRFMLYNKTLVYAKPVYLYKTEEFPDGVHLSEIRPKGRIKLMSINDEEKFIHDSYTTLKDLDYKTVKNIYIYFKCSIDSTITYRDYYYKIQAISEELFKKDLNEH